MLILSLTRTDSMDVFYNQILRCDKCNEYGNNDHNGMAIDKRIEEISNATKQNKRTKDVL